MQDIRRQLRPRRWRAICLAVLGACASAAIAQPADAAPAAAAAAPDTRKVDVSEYIVRGNTALDVGAIEQAVTPFLGPQRTMQDIEAARDALLALYQAQGFQSVYVDLPEQQVTEGIVLLQVTETRVGRVRVVGAAYTSPLEVREQVPALREGSVPNFTQAQTELTALNKGPKRQVMPLVRQGSLPGTMDVDLKVEDASPWRASAGLNNDYSADTKQLRASASLGHDNLWQLGHSASLSFFGAPQDLEQTQVFSASYTAPIPRTNWSLEAAGYKSDSNVATVGGTDVLGKGYSIGLKASYAAPAAGNWYHGFSVGVDLKSNEEALRMGTSTDEVPLKYAPITLAYNGFMQGERNQFALGLSLVVGTSSFLGYGSDAAAFSYKRYKAQPSFMALKADVNGSYSLGNDWQLGYRAAGQMTDSPLISSEQMAAGGMHSVRGYLSAEATGDYGLAGSLELRSRPLALLDPWVENWRVYGFVDAAHLRLRSPLVEQKDRFSLRSVGVGTSFRVGASVAGRVDLGYPLRAGARTPRHEPRVNFSLTANY